SPVYHTVYVEDVDAAVDRASARGAAVKRPVQDQFYGDRTGFIIDPFGHGWVIASQLTLNVDFTGRGIGKLLVPLIVRRQAAREISENIRRLKQRLETTPVVQHPSG
ncbi:MAG: VOC family protein, partial [Solirubrobacteraceae bacterium]